MKGQSHFYGPEDQPLDCICTYDMICKPCQVQYQKDTGNGEDVLIKKCECGSATLGSPHHSHYCPLFSEESK